MDAQHVLRLVHAEDGECRLSGQGCTRRRHETERIANTSRADFPEQCSKAEKHAIIQEWQDLTSP